MIRAADVGSLAGRGFDDEAVAEVRRIVAALEEGVACLVTGSIVEGLGNPTSDVDLYLLHPGRPRDTVSIGMRRSWYVDCEHLPVASLSALARQVGELTWAGVPALRRADLDRYYRIAIGIPVALTDEAAGLLEEFTAATATTAFERLALLRAFEYVATAAACAASGRDGEADLRLREGAWWHASALLAAAGEGYPSVKWAAQKAARRHGRGSERFHELVDDAVRPSGPLPDRLDRLRRRLAVPDELRAVLDARACRLRPGVRLAGRGDERLLVDAGRTVATVRGVTAATCAHLAGGDPWPEATARAAAELDLPVAECRAAAWTFLAPLRRAGLVETGRDGTG